MLRYPRCEIYLSLSFGSSHTFRPLPPPEAFSSVFFAGARVRLGRCGRCCRSARERSRCRNLRRVSPQSKVFSCHLSVLTHRIAAGIMLHCDSFGGVIPDVLSSGSVGRLAGAVVARTCAGDRKVEIYDMFHTPGAYIPPTAFVCEDA